MRKVHFMLQGKGGIGKSYVATLIAERYLRNGDADNLVCIDTDPVNKTLASYPALKAMRLDLLEKGAVKERNFDVLLERVINEDKDFVIDNGSTSFLPVSRYLSLVGALDMIAEAGKKVVIHSVIVGGQPLLDTLHGFDTLARATPATADMVVWLNEFQGPVVSPEGKPFEKMKVYEEHKERITSLIRLAEPPADMFREDLRALTERHLLFMEASKHPEFQLAAKQRLRQMEREIFPQLERLI